MAHIRYQNYKPSGVAWLGDIPAHWEARRLKTIARFGYGDSLPTEERLPGEYDVYGSNGLVGQHAEANTRGPCIIVGRKGSSGKVAYSEKPSFAIDTTYFIDERLTRSNLRWLYYSLQSLCLDSFSKDSAVPGLAREDAYESVIAFCGVSEQRAIAAFLDRETERIDALIEKKLRQTELLQEKRAALISHAVAKGLNPDAPSKDSGIEWLGQIPAHWDMVRLKHVSPRQSVGLVITPSIYVDPDGSVPFLFGADVTDFGINAKGARRITEESNLALHQSMLRCGDLVTVRVGYPGTTAVVPPELDRCNCASMMIIRKPRKCRPEWLCYVMNSPVGRSQVDVVEYGAAQKQFNIGHAVEFRIPIPPPEEQTQIVGYLDRERTRLATLEGKVLNSIGFLREYRTALISAAVTGQIDVRGEVM